MRRRLKGRVTIVTGAGQFFASDESSYVTGECLPVDGGRAA